jgi:hypothetical protein
LTLAVDSGALTALIRGAAIGDILPPGMFEFGGARRLDATAFILPGSGDLRGYLASLDAATNDFAAWDGRTVLIDADAEQAHRVLIVDRYGQVYDAVDAVDVNGLPDAHAIEEWFRFLATAYPECGVLDDPRERDWTP